jgi:hypothetical protein
MNVGCDQMNVGEVVVIIVQACRVVNVGEGRLSLYELNIRYYCGKP